MDTTSNKPASGLQPQDVVMLRRQLARALGLTHFGWNLAGEVVEVVERMHGTISRAPLPWRKLKRDTALGISGFVYRMIRQSFAHLSNGFAEASRALQAPNDASDGGWLQFQAALNGVCGDRLQQQDSPLAINMRLSRFCRPDGDTAHQVEFLHGLCMSEQGWHNPAHESFCQQLELQHGCQINYLRYNSGLHISENGASLSALLEQRLHAAKHISLIGHSMGGLLIRSALHAAQQAGHSWPQRLLHVVFLGSPHHGAPLERVGNHANRLLKLSPYLNPFSRLGDLRSAGIRDLRHGNICEDDWRDLQQDDETQDRRRLCPLPNGPRYLLLAASLSNPLPQSAAQARHDYLVPVSSALGLATNTQQQLHANKLTRVVLPAINHLDLLKQPQVYQQILDSM